MTTSTSNSNRLSNGHQSDDKEEDRINLQALQHRDPYISKIVDQAQRVCVYKFVAEKREWVNTLIDLEARFSLICVF